MSNVHEYATAAEAIDRLALQFQQMVQASAALRNLSRYEQIKAESEAASAQARADQQAVLVSKQAVQDEIVRAKEEAKRIVDEARATADNTVAQANDKASSILGSARHDAESARDAAAKSAEKMQLSSRQALEGLQTQIDDASRHLVELQARCDKTKAELASANAQLEAAREAIRTVIGGE